MFDSFANKEMKHEKNLRLIGILAESRERQQKEKMGLSGAYENTSAPYPTTAVSNLGPKSRAGLIAYPQLYPKQIPMFKTTNPTAIGTI